MNSRSTGDLNIIIWFHMKKLKINTSVQDLEHVDNEIDLAGLKGWEGMSRQPQASEDRLVFPVGHGGPCWFSSVQGRLLPRAQDPDGKWRNIFLHSVLTGLTHVTQMSV